MDIQQYVHNVMYFEFDTEFKREDFYKFLRKGQKRWRYFCTYETGEQRNILGVMALHYIVCLEGWLNNNKYIQRIDKHTVQFEGFKARFVNPKKLLETLNQLEEREFISPHQENFRHFLKLVVNETKPLDWDIVKLEDIIGKSLTET